MSLPAREEFHSTISGNRVVVLQVELRRDDEDNISFISCDEIPDLFVATAPERIRVAIDSGLKAAYGPDAEKVEVFTNGQITGPTIAAMVKLTTK